MKKLKLNQLGPWCEFCPTKTTRATHVAKGFVHFCCEQHKPDSAAIERKEEEREGNYSEADYQTWLRL